MGKNCAWVTKKNHRPKGRKIIIYRLLMYVVSFNGIHILLDSQKLKFERIITVKIQGIIIVAKPVSTVQKQMVQISVRFP